MPPSSYSFAVARSPEITCAPAPPPLEAVADTVTPPLVDAATRKRFDRLYRDHGARIYRWSLHLTGGDCDGADDLTQEVLLAAYAGLPRFAGRAAQTTWLYRIAVYRWRDLRDRDRRARSGTADVVWEAASAYAPGPPLDRAVADRVVLEAALAALPEPLRVAFLLVKAEGLTYREAARVLETPQGTIQSRVHDARLLLQRLLSEPDEAVSVKKEPKQ